MRKPYATTPAERVGVLAPNTGIAIGQHVPDVHGRDLDSKDVALAALYAKGPLLLVFYRGGWCPYCNTEIHELVKCGVSGSSRSVASRSSRSASTSPLTPRRSLHATYFDPIRRAQRQ